jgi:hypothetical protein
VCRAVRVLCVGQDEATLAALQRATVAAEWELLPGATTEKEALGLVDRERPHALVAFGSYDGLVALVRERFPGMRIVTDRPAPGASAVVGSPDEIRETLRGLGRPGGPVRAEMDG